MTSSAWPAKACVSRPSSGTDLARERLCSREFTRNSASATEAAMTDTGTKKTELYDLVEGIEIAMFTTRRPDGRLVSRPMATQARAAGADLWFVTDASAYKLDELEQEPQVNLAYYNQKSREYVSVSGTARVSNDRAKIAELYRPDWKAWFDGDS
jgi:general stress protein 26